MEKFIAWLSRLFVAKIDTNHDGVVSEDEALETLRPIAREMAKQLNKRAK